MKSLYSLILTDEVIKRIDKTAEVLKMNRSGLINEILADYVSYITPEKKIKKMFKDIAEKVSGTELQISSDFSGKFLAIKSSLDYKYKPTITYNVEIFRTSTNDAVGELKIIYRIHSKELLYKIGSFFENFIKIEKIFSIVDIKYYFCEGKFSKTFIAHELNYSQDDIALAISDYIINFDILMKKYLSGQYYNMAEMEQDYKILMSKSIIV